MRLDIYLTETGLAPSRNRAQTLISDGCVFVGTACITKASFAVSEQDVVRIAGNPIPFVGRGGLKLAHALAVFQPQIGGGIFADIGASTGGFTDCLLQNGAKRVYAVDSGTNQLAETLRRDSRVVVMEQCNARYLTLSMLGAEAVNGVVTDVSFISLTLLMDAIAGIIKENGFLIALIKPQFEAGRGALDKKGIVKKEQDRENAIKRVVLAAKGRGFVLHGLVPSPITGGDGNHEYLSYFRYSSSPAETTADALIDACMAAERSRYGKNIAHHQ